MSGVLRLSVPSICLHGVHRYDTTMSFITFKLPVIQGDSEGTANVSGGDNVRKTVQMEWAPT